MTCQGGSMQYTCVGIVAQELRERRWGSGHEHFFEQASVLENPNCLQILGWSESISLLCLQDIILTATPLKSTNPAC